MTKKKYDPLDTYNTTINPQFPIIKIIGLIIIGIIIFIVYTWSHSWYQNNVIVDYDCVDSVFAKRACYNYASRGSWIYNDDYFYFECIQDNRTDTIIVMYHESEVKNICSSNSKFYFKKVVP